MAPQQKILKFSMWCIPFTKINLRMIMHDKGGQLLFGDFFVMAL